MGRLLGAPPRAPPIAAVSAPFGRGNEECTHLDHTMTQINQVGVFCVVSHFLFDSFTGFGSKVLKRTLAVDGSRRGLL